MALDQDAFERQIARIETLVAQLERSPDPGAKMATREMVRALLELHSAGLARILDWLKEGGAGGRAVLNACAQDDLVRHLLMLHDLHPKDIETRVREALAKLGKRLSESGGAVELLGVADGVVRIRLQEECSHNGDASSHTSLKSRVEQAVLEAAPDAVGIECENTGTLHVSECTPHAPREAGACCTRSV